MNNLCYYSLFETFLPAMLRFIVSFSFLPLLLLAPAPLRAGDGTNNAVYIVYTGAANPANLAVRETLLNSLLQSGGRREMDVLRTYSHGLSGFAARMSPDEAASMAAQPGVVSVFPDFNLELYTTRSWDFLDELSKSGVVPITSSSPALDSSNVVIGIFDSGIWPESASFRQQGANPSMPRGWKGTCVTGRDFHETACNGTKIIGARYYMGDTPRDEDGHGSHVASTAAGAAVENASFYDGLAVGTARGGSGTAKIAVYKVCDGGGCRSWGILGAFDEAIADGVNVISLSIGFLVPDGEFSKDPLAIGAFHAVERGITVVCAAGNTGPRPSTVTNDAPWILTVGASTIDRAFQSNILLGGGKVVKGEWIRVRDLSSSPVYPLIDGRSAKNDNVSCRAARMRTRFPKQKKVEGKIVVCNIKVNNGFNYAHQAREVVMKGGLSVIIANNDSKRVVDHQWHFPITRVGSREAAQLRAYLKTTRNPLATFLPTVVVGNYTPAPEVASFSSRGPSNNSADIIKPDIAAPGIGILAAWTGRVDVGDLPKGRSRRPSFEIDSGTSMACPHVSGVAANIKAANPDFSPSAIKSAIMTSAFSKNNLGSRITSHTGEEATPYDFGAGVVNPSGSLNPGLVYDTSVRDYLLFMCYHGYNTSTVRWISRVAQSSNFTCPHDSDNSDLVSTINYPSISVLLRGANRVRTVPRLLTNVAGEGNWTYTAVVGFGEGGRLPCVSVKIFPKRLSFTKMGEKHHYKVKFTAKGGHVMDRVVYGWITWSNPHFKVRSPFVIRGKLAASN